MSRQSCSRCSGRGRGSESARLRQGRPRPGAYRPSSAARRRHLPRLQARGHGRRPSSSSSSSMGSARRSTSSPTMTCPSYETVRVRRPQTSRPADPVVAVPVSPGASAADSLAAPAWPRRGRRRQRLHRPSSLLPVATGFPQLTILTVRLPPAATAARTRGSTRWPACASNRCPVRPDPALPRSAEAVAGDRADVGARLGWPVARARGFCEGAAARKFLFALLTCAGSSQASRTACGLVHALRALDQEAEPQGGSAHHTPLATVIPEVLHFYIGTHGPTGSALVEGCRASASRPAHGREEDNSHRRRCRHDR